MTLPEADGGKAEGCREWSWRSSWSSPSVKEAVIFVSGEVGHIAGLAAQAAFTPTPKSSWKG